MPLAVLDAGQQAAARAQHGIELLVFFTDTPVKPPSTSLHGSRMETYTTKNQYDHLRENADGEQNAEGNSDGGSDQEQDESLPQARQRQKFLRRFWRCLFLSEGGRAEGESSTAVKARKTRTSDKSKHKSK